MKKEVFLAIGIGFALGLVITFGIWTANKSLRQLQPTPSPLPSPFLSPPPAGEAPQATPLQLTLTVTSPQDEAVVNTSTVVLAGRTAGGATVVATYENGEQLVEADANGAFSLQVKLIAGYNTISVSAFDGEGNEVSETLTVTYTTAKI